MSDLVVKYATENDDLKERIAELESIVAAPDERLSVLRVSLNRVAGERDRLRAALESAPKPEYSMSIPSAWTNPEYADWYLGPRTEALEAGKESSDE